MYRLPRRVCERQLTRTLQFIVCQMPPGTNMVTTYFGYTWWDNEMDGEQMYPAKQHNPSPAEQQRIQFRNPERAAQRGLWSDLSFLDKVGSPEFAKTLKHTQFAD